MMFDNSRDALIHIAQQHGNDVLLGKQLKSFFTDYAPQVPRNVRELVFVVNEKGAAAILQRGMGANAAEQEIAFKQAVAKLTEAFIAQEAAEGIIREFVAALGWQLNAPIQPTQPSPPPVRQSAPAPAITETAVEIVKGETQHIQFGGYTWRVLDVIGNSALILTEDIVELRPYNVKNELCTWETCTLRQYLNGEFLQKFTETEQKKIIRVHKVNGGNHWYGASGGKKTGDYICLLDLNEVARFFGDSGELGNLPSDDGRIDDQYNDQRIAKYGNESVGWWLRSLGADDTYAACITEQGWLSMFGKLFDVKDIGVRPALWLRLK